MMGISRRIYVLPFSDYELKNAIVDIARRAYGVLDIRDYGRVDVRLKDGVPYVLEINSLQVW